MEQEILQSIKARNPVIWIVTPEEARTEKVIGALLRRIIFKGEEDKNKIPYIAWSTITDSGGPNWTYPRGETQSSVLIPKDLGEADSHLTAIENFIKYNKTPAGKEGLNAILFRNAQYLDDPDFVCALKEASISLQDSGGVVFLTSVTNKIPEELKPAIKVIVPGPPKADVIRTFVAEEIEKYQKVKNTWLKKQGKKQEKLKITNSINGDIEDVVNAVKGLTLMEIHDLLITSFSTKQACIDVEFIASEKVKRLSDIRGLTLIKKQYDLSDVGGLKNLKDWIKKRKRIFSPEAKKYGINPPKGFVTIGVPGCVWGNTEICVIIKDKDEPDNRDKELIGLTTIERLYNNINSPRDNKYKRNQLYCLCYDEKTKETVEQRIRKVTYSGIKTTLRVATTEHFDIDVTEQHELLLANGEYKQANFLCGGEVLAKNAGEVMSVEVTGDKPVYDISIDGKYSNFIANNIVVHNCGKSLIAKAVASEYNLPLVRLNLAELKGGIVGETEVNTRNVLKILDSLSPVICWIDEIEKGLPANSAQNLDGGSSAGMLQLILTWLQEREGEIYCVCTANDVSALPPELIRKGRFDEIFFVDMPGSPEEIVEILKVHTQRKNRTFTDKEYFNLAKELITPDGSFTGAEIEAAVNEALITAFNEERDLTPADIKNAINMSVPMYQTMAERIDALRDWCRYRAVPASDSGYKEKEELSFEDTEELENNADDILSDMIES